MSASDADRQLLLGMFAVHLGMCSADEVCDAVSSWSASPDAPLAAELDVRGLLSGRQIRLIEDLVDERLSSDGAGVWQWCSRHLKPDFIQRLQLGSGDSLKSRLAALGETLDQSVGLPGQQAETAVPNDASRSADWDEASLHGGAASRYRILRHHAQGGLGKVSVAEDVPLGREVAFKELRSDRAGDVVSRSRFVLEAKVTGRLEHPSIVPVYDVGRQSGGEPFYVMKFIHGKSLKEIIKRFHSSKGEAAGDGGAAPSLQTALERNVEFRGLLNRFIAVCQAVEYAHKHGVIHRDLKPANVMLGEYGETLLVDWGLAKLIDQPVNEALEATFPVMADAPLDLTTEGAAVGTPAYMSPEQAAGWSDKITQATDIYGLGATLFSIITGRTPISGESLPDVIDRVKRGQVEVHVEGGSPGVPAALWAVCRKAMRTDPRERYASAAALAKDIERFLADEPVSAMREPMFARAKRWIRRHPTLVSTASAVSLMAIVSLVAGLSIVTGFSNELESANGQLTQANDDLERINGELNDTNAQLATANVAEHEARVQAETSLRFASDSVDTFLSQVTDNIELQRPDMNEIRRGLLVSALPYFEQLLDQAPGDANVEFMRGKAYIRLSAIHEELHDYTLALEEIEQAVEILKGVVDANPTTADYVFHLAVAQNNWGTLLDDLARFDESRRVYEETLETRRRYAELTPEDEFGRRDHARTLTNLGLLASTDGDFEAAIGYHQQAMEIRLELLEELGRTSETLFELANSYTNIGIAYIGADRGDEALAAFHTSEALHAESTSLPEVSHQSWMAYASTLDNLGTAYGVRGQLDEALDCHERVVEINRRLYRQYPLSLDIRRELAESLLQLVETRRQRFEFADALPLMEEMLAHFAELDESFSNSFEFARDHARMHFVAGLLMLDTSQYTSSNEYLRESADMLNALIASLPDGSHERLMLTDRLADAVEARATSLSYLGDYARAEESFLEAAELRGKLAEALDDPINYLGGRADALHNAAMQMSIQEQFDEALDHFQQALELRQGLIDLHPEDEYLLSQQATTHNGLAILLYQTEEYDACREHYESCIEMCDELCAMHGDNINYHTTGGGAACNLGNLEMQLGNTEAAFAWYETALNEFDAVLQLQPNYPLARRFLAITLNGRGELLQMEERYAEAARDWERGAEFCDPPLIPYYKMYEAYSRSRIGEHELAFQLVAAHAATSPDTLFTAALVYTVAADQEEDDAVQAVYLDSAMRYLLDAEAVGYFAQEAGWMHLQENLDLDLLRGREDFKELLERAGM